MGDDLNLFDELDPKAVEEEDKKDAKKIEHWVANLAVVLGGLFVLLVIIGALALMPTSTWRAERFEITKTLVSNETILHEDEVPISFEEMKASEDDLVGTMQTFLGFPQKEQKDRGQVQYYILDDWFRKFKVQKVPEENRADFEFDTVTRFPYEITASFHKGIDGVYVNINSMIITTRPVNESLEVITRARNETERRVRYWEEEMTLFSYVIEYLGTYTDPRINCEDGSRLTECASQEPFFCTRRGFLEKDPQQCGCPTNTTNVNGECLDVGSLAIVE